jgi:hypothetical protein
VYGSGAYDDAVFEVELGASDVHQDTWSENCFSMSE